MTSAKIGLHSVRNLASDRRPSTRQIVLLGDQSYARARKIPSGSSPNDATFALCEGAEDVQAAVNFARTHDLALSVLGGGHDWEPRAARNGGLVIDLSLMRRVDIDADARIATVAAGATAKDIIAAAARYGLVPVTGTIGAMGMAGLKVGGGYGPLSGQFGLAIDNLLSVDVVLSDGQLVTASQFENADLFWALRGGGGNFGVVTSVRLRLHPVRAVLSGLIFFAWSEAEAVLRGYAAAAAAAPDELTILAGIVSNGKGEPVVFLAPTWSGDPAKGEEVVAGLRRLGTPLTTRIARTTLGHAFGVFEAHVVNGGRRAAQTRWLPMLTRNAISALVALGNTKNPSFSAIVLHHFHGAATRVPSDATAFGMRREHFLVEVISANELGADFGAARRQRVSDLTPPLPASAARPNGLRAMLGRDDRDMIELAYGPNINRLRDVKQRFDPEGIFSSVIPLPAQRPYRSADSDRPRVRSAEGEFELAGAEAGENGLPNPAIARGANRAGVIHRGVTIVR
jgi:FAD/FMN-containing dehydrogenase